MQNTKLVYQDGGQFYDAHNAKLIADYAHLVSGDYDLIGAEAARAQFMRDYPDFIVEA